MGKGHKFSGLTEKTPQAIQVGAGVFCVNVPEFKDKPTFEELIKVVEDARQENRVLGATRGGGTFVASIETSVIEIDDMKHPLEGTVEITGQEARFTGTTVELKKDTMKLILPMSHEDETHGGLTMSSVLLPSHYLENVLWIGNMTSGGATAIMIYKALNTEGVTLTFTQSGGATMPFNYLAHQPDPGNVQFAPFHIWFIAAPADTTTGNGSGTADITIGTPLEGMTIAQMLEFAENHSPPITIPAGVTLRADIATVILLELGLL
jgi:hypothetical protein